jgi:putative flippase GtrA
MRINVNALVMWGTLTLGFHLFGGNPLTGLFIGLVISLLVAFIPNKY